MRSRIIEKLNKLIHMGINTEEKVYYLIGQSRKYLESEKETKAEREKEYPTLSLIEDWILHPKLEGSGAQNKLKEYAEHLKKPMGDPFKFLEKFSLFPDLKKDMEKFCLNYDLNTKFLQKPRWNKFIELLIEILIDLPLEGKENTFIKKFQFKQDDNPKTISILVIDDDGIHGQYSIDKKILTEYHPAYKNS